MRKIYATFILCIGALVAFGQSNTYLFNSTFNEVSGNGPALSEALACTAPAGNFGTSVINTSTGNCGTGARSVFNFNQGGGISYPNGQVTGTYTVHMFFSFSSVNGYRRLIDFLDGQTDIGLYILDGSLNFFPNGNVGTLNSFAANTFYLLSLVRDGATNQIQLYLNGTSFGSYSDIAGNYVAPTTSTPIFLFRDNIAGSAQCENSAGKIKYFNISPTVSTPAQVATTYNTICAIALPVNVTGFTVTGQEATNLLSWQTGQEMNTAAYVIQRSADAKTWEQIGQQPARGMHAYTYTDQAPLSGWNYYRLAIMDVDGTTKYSQVISKMNTANLSGVAILPIPAERSIKIINGNPSLMGATGIIYDIQGREIYKLSLKASQTLDITTWPAGMYTLRIPGQEAIRIIKR